MSAMVEPAVDDASEEAVQAAAEQLREMNEDKHWDTSTESCKKILHWLRGEDAA